MASSSEKKLERILSTPSHFQKVSKHNLIPPSLYSNQASSNLSANIKTPSDFTLKQSNNTNCEMGKVVELQLPTVDTQNVNIDESNASHKSSRSDSFRQCNMKNQENLANGNHINSSYSTDTNTMKSTSANAMSNCISRPPPGLSLQHHQRTCDVSVSRNHTMHLQQNDNKLKEKDLDNLECYSSNNGTVSKKEYTQLENMYTESKNKLDKLEIRFSKIRKAYEKQKIENNAENENSYEEKLTKQLETFKFQNEFLRDKLQNLEQGQFSDVKVVVDRYLSQNQHETEKVALNNRIIELERNLFEMNKENENLLKAMEVKDLKYEKAMIRNNEERYSYEECIAKLNAKITEMIDENEKLRNEKEDCLGKYENSVKTVVEMNQIIETKNKCIDDLSMKINQEMNTNNHLSDKIEKQRETFEASLANVEKMLKEEVINNSNLNGEITERKNHIKQLENNLHQINNFTHELQRDNDNIKSLKNHLDLKCEEIIQLQSSCRTLQSTNETLNIRLNSLNEMLHMQQPYMKGFLNGDKHEKMLQMWREKVYSLLVMLKLQEMKTKNGVEDSDIDGSSIL